MKSVQQEKSLLMYRKRSNRADVMWAPMISRSNERKFELNLHNIQLSFSARLKVRGLMFKKGTTSYTETTRRQLELEETCNIILSLVTSMEPN